MAADTNTASFLSQEGMVLMQLTKTFLLFALVMGMSCSPTGGNIISGASPTDGPRPDALNISLNGPSTNSTDGGIFVIESYGFPVDGGIVTRQNPTDGGEDPQVFPPDAATPPPPASDAATIIPPSAPDASIPDTVVAIQPDLAPDTTTRNDVYISDVYVPDTYVPVVTLLPPSPDVLPMPDVRTPDAYVPDTYIAPDLVVAPDVYVPDVFIPTDAWTAPDTTPDTTPDIIAPDTTPPPECTTESPTNVSGITLIQSSAYQFTVVWEVDGCSSMGYKVIWSKNPGPTYPTRNGDHYEFLSDPNEKELAIETGSSGTYYVRVCQYLGGKCGLYSNELVITLN
jgi:hypothetical protein